MRLDSDAALFASLDQRRFAGKYVVIVSGELIGAGKNLLKLLARARKEHPGEVPFVAQVRDPRKVCVY